MSDFNNQDPEQELTFDERFKLAVQKYRPYLLRLWEAKWKFIKINALMLVVYIEIRLI